jgi:hypothetical protein
MRDSELPLRRAWRPLMIGMASWEKWWARSPPPSSSGSTTAATRCSGRLNSERRPFDPVPRPRTAAEITDAEDARPGDLLAGPDTQLRDRDLRFAESRTALGQRTLLIAITDAPRPGRRWTRPGDRGP